MMWDGNGGGGSNINVRWEEVGRVTRIRLDGNGEGWS